MCVAARCVLLCDVSSAARVAASEEKARARQQQHSPVETAPGHFLFAFAAASAAAALIASSSACCAAITHDSRTSSRR